MGYLVSFGALGQDGNPSEAGIERAISIHEEYTKNGKIDLPFECVPKTEPNPNPPDLRDKEKYKDWYNRWIYGTYKSILNTLEGEPNAACPVFDPTGVAAKLNLPVPDLDLASIIASFAVPPAVLPVLLNIKPNDIPSFLEKLPKLISPPKIPIPELPPLPKLPDYALNLPATPGLPPIPPTPPVPGVLFGGQGVPGYPSREGFNLALFTSIPKVFTSILEEVINPAWWLDFTPVKMFELACKSTQKIMPQPLTSYPVSYQANVAMITTLMSEAMAAKIVGEVIAGNTLLRIMGAKKGYQTRKEPKTDKDGEALLNNLYRLQPNELNLAVLFPQRTYYYGDQHTIDMIQALAAHMYKETSYRKSPSEESVTVEIGNITGKQGEQKSGDNGGFKPANPGWRHNPWSSGHGGGSYDSAYPMRDASGNWMSGVSDNEVTDGTSMGETGNSPFRHGGNAAIPFRIDGKLVHDFPAMYEMARYVYYDWLFNLAKDGRLVKWVGSEAKVSIPLRTILIGKEIMKEFSKWGRDKFGVNWIAQPKYPQGYEGNYAMFEEWQSHEDHMHWNCNRTTIDITKTNERGTTVYKCRSAPEKLFRYEIVSKKIDDNKVYKARI